jgi:hypothetical protein
MRIGGGRESVYKKTQKRLGGESREIKREE